ncbi:minor spike protein H, partial [Chlamydia psittaci 02DC18]
SNLSRK